MSQPMACWRCDVCKSLIEEPAQGYVVWKNDGEYRAYEFKIIHKVKCDRNDHPSSSALEDFLGHEGLTKLLSHLSLGPIKVALGQGKPSGVVSIDEFIDLIRRVQTPFYEAARQNFTKSEVLNDYSDANELMPYSPDQLQSIASRY